MKRAKHFLTSWTRTLLGDRITDFTYSIYDYIMNKKNPIVMIIYLILAIGGFAVYVIVGFNRFIPGPYVGEIHKSIGTFIMLICYFSFYLAWATGPGVIKKGNLN